MSFNEVNPETAKPWTRAELFQELETARAKHSDLSDALDLTPAEQQFSDIISWPAQSANLRARWAIHQEEFDIAIKDLKSLYKAVLVFVENQREYWATNPLIKQQ